MVGISFENGLILGLEGWDLPAALVRWTGVCGWKKLMSQETERDVESERMARELNHKRSTLVIVHK